MLTTGRAVEAQEALAIGLAQRVVPAGEARAAAEELAAQIAAFPPLAMRADRWSAFCQSGLPVEEALRIEIELAREAKAKEAQAGASRFAGGAGRHGSFAQSGG
jgi:enoyl-CoA hydratase